MWATSTHEALWNFGHYRSLGDMQFQIGTYNDTRIARTPYYSICNVKVIVFCGKMYKHTIYYCLVKLCIKENCPCYNVSTISKPILNFSSGRSDGPYGSPCPTTLYFYDSYPHYLLRYYWWLNLQLRWGLLCNYCHMFSRWAHSLVTWWAQDRRNQLMLVKRVSTSSSCILTGHRSTIVKLILHNCKYCTYYWKGS